MNFCKTLQSSINAEGIWSDGESRAMSLLLLEEVAGLSTADVLMERDDAMSDATKEQLRGMAARISQGEPVQYVLGFQRFCGLKIGVAPGVLIPRPETEELVMLIVDEVQKTANSSGIFRILDIGTGSGCIALALKHLLGERAKVEAWDLSEDALLMAQKNAESLGLDVHFERHDILAPEAYSGQFDIIVSNPPYVCQSEANEMERNVIEYEPEMALFVKDNDPLLFYRTIAQEAHSLLLPNGRLFFEINQRFGQETKELLEEQGLSDIMVRKDAFGNDRMVKGKAPSKPPRGEAFGR